MSAPNSSSADCNMHARARFEFGGGGVASSSPTNRFVSTARCLSNYLPADYIGLQPPCPRGGHLKDVVAKKITLNVM